MACRASCAVVALLVAGTISHGDPASSDPVALAASLAERLAGAIVAMPDGSEARVLPPGPAGAEVLLTPERLATCLETVTEAEAWPVAWLVVQRADLDADLVMRVALTGEEVSTPDFLFVVPRRDWQVDDLPGVVRRATGRKAPREGRGNLVIQGFSTRVVTTYVYEAPKTTGKVRGLRALLPEGTLIREARVVDLADGRRYTLALVLDEATFVPASCADCASELFGHADSGTVGLVLTDEERIVDRLDLTPHLKGVDGTPRVPRYACDERHANPESVEALLAEEPTVRLLELADLDGDGLPLEITLPAEYVDCENYLKLVAAIRPDGPGLEIVGVE